MNMSEAKHTPGPWVADAEDIHFSQDGERDVCPAPRRGRRLNGGFIIARISGPDRAANARLIAAAPELLETLQIIADGFARGSIKSKLMLAYVDDEAADTMPTTAAELVRAAIAKATDLAS
jgi:hypothetical protein